MPSELESVTTQVSFLERRTFICPGCGSMNYKGWCGDECKEAAHRMTMQIILADRGAALLAAIKEREG